MRPLIYLTFLFITFNSFSSEENIICNNCSSTNSYIQKIMFKAESLANLSNAGFDGNINVINPTDNKVYSLKVTSKWIFKGGDEPSLNTLLYSRTPSSQLVSQLDDLSKLKIFEHARMG